MSVDPFDELLELENDFYKEGFEAGVADSAYAGLIEGKLFGLEKGYDKAIELGKARGRALVWEQRLAKDLGAPTNAESGSTDTTLSSKSDAETDISTIASKLDPLPNNARLRKHVDFLVSITDPTSVPKDNSDESVSEVDERVTKIRARMKMLSNLWGEPANPGAASATGIEEATGLSARH